MPKPTKLHDKGRPISIQKSHKPETGEGSTETNNENVVRQFELELCWCIQQLERTLTSKKGTEKQIQETWKILHVLKNKNQPMIRKRQLMRSHFGDYRAKMLAEEKKLIKMASKMKICEKPVPPKATFLRKSVFQTTGDSSFRFNFDVKSEEIDYSNPKTKENNIEAGNTETSTSNPGKTTSGNTVTNSGDSNTKNTPVTENSSNTFKFKTSGSEFRFNFDVNNTYSNK